jgi:hypothetical protein
LTDPKSRKPAPGAAGRDRERFDAGYYQRFYLEKETRAHGPEEIARLARGIEGMSSWLLQRELHSVLEIGSGPGFIRDWFARERPKLRFVSTDVSAHACEKFHHTRLDISREQLEPEEKFDLIICQGVLQYLEKAEAERAIKNIAAMCDGLLYLEVLTSRDLKEICDPSGTDTEVNLRAGRFYREVLAKSFVQIGAGLWAVREGPVALYELEAPPLRAP